MRYKDEKYVEALEEQVKALEAKLRLRGEGGRGLRGGREQGVGSAVQAEELYRRARTEVAAEAGAGYGRVSLEAMYLLPSEFTNAYQRLFLRALKESPGGGGDEGRVLVKGRAKLTKGKVIKNPGSPDDGKVLGVDVPLDRDPDRGGGQARGGGKRHRDHWLIKDERAFRLKGRIDAELRELAMVVELSLRAAGSSDGSTPDKVTSVPQCAGCQRFLKVTWKFCPGCGVRVER